MNKKNAFTAEAQLSRKMVLRTINNSLDVMLVANIFSVEIESTALNYGVNM